MYIVNDNIFQIFYKSSLCLNDDFALLQKQRATRPQQLGLKVICYLCKVFVNTM